MSGFPLANFTVSDRGLFSTAEIKELMRIENARAGRYGYPIALLLIEVDRLESLHDLYGVESKREILNGIVGLLRSETRGSDFIGCLDDDRVMALFPHTHNDGASALAGRLLRASRRLDFESDGRSLRTTLSIGASVAEPERGSSFEDLIRTSEEALRFAIVEGGDRFVLRQPASDFFQELRGELEENVRLLGEEHRRLDEDREAQGPPPEPLPRAEAVEKRPPVLPAELPEVQADEEIGARVHELFLAVDRVRPDWERLEGDVTGLAVAFAARAREAALLDAGGDHARKVDLLERRVAKLKDLLDLTEAELLRIARLKNVDTGVASIYKTVQGLDDEERDSARKKEMLTILFEANVQLRREIQDKP